VTGTPHTVVLRGVLRGDAGLVSFRLEVEASVRPTGSEAPVVELRVWRERRKRNPGWLEETETAIVGARVR